MATRVELDSDTAVLIKGGNERKSGTEQKQRRWKVFRDPRRGRIDTPQIFCRRFLLEHLFDQLLQPRPPYQISLPLQET